jgi:hypothetical protein
MRQSARSSTETYNTSKVFAVRAVWVAFALLQGCRGDELSTVRGKAILGSAASLPSVSRQEVARRLRLGGEADRALPGAPLTSIGYLAVLRRPTEATQVRFTITEDGEDAQRVVYADEIDTRLEEEILRGTLRPTPRQDWPLACRRYRLVFSDSAGELSRGEVTTGGCRRALEDLRGRILFYIGKKTLSLADDPRPLAAFRKAIGARRVLEAPAGEAFHLGWKAAFATPAGVHELRAELEDLDAARAVRRFTVALDPSWDTLGQGFDISPNETWLVPGHRYELRLLRGQTALARGEFMVRRHGTTSQQAAAQ